MQIEIQCSKGYSKKFLPQGAGAFGNNRKGTAKTTPKIEKYAYYICTENIYSACRSMQVKVFFQIEQRLKFCYFEGSIIP